MRFTPLALLITCTLNTIALAQDIIIDNEDAAFSQTLGTWTLTGTPLGYPGGSGSYLWASGTGTSTPSEVCEWRPTIATAGWYEVAVWYVEGANRPTDAPYAVVHSSGSSVRDIDQEANGSQWVTLGTYHFNAGTGGYVELSNACESGQAVIADAVRFSPTSAPEGEIRAVWASRYQWPGTTQSSTESNIDSIMTNAVAGNFNTVLFQIRGQCDTLYPSPNEPWSPIFGSSDPGYDPVPYALNAAHSRGISIHAYINTHTIWGSSTPPSSPNHVYNTHPEWRLHDHQRNVAPFWYYYYMNPGIPEADTWVREQVMYAVETYDFDGIHFDRVRMYEEGYGTSPIAVARWDDEGTDAPNDGPGNPDNLDWDDFMRDAVTRSLINITGESWTIDPDCVVSSAPLGLWRHDAYPSYPDYYEYSYLLGQDAKAWMQAGAMDFIVPQIYWGDGGDSPHFTDLYTDWQAAADAAGRFLVPGSSNTMRVETIGDGRTRQEEVERHAEIARAGGAAGHCLWHCNSTDYATWASPGHPNDNITTYPTFPWRSTEGVIVCRVYESDGVTPITDAWVTRTGSTWTALSSADGLCAFLRLTPGTYTVTAQHPDYATAQVTGVTVTAGAATEVNILMSVVPVELSLFGAN